MKPIISIYSLTIIHEEQLKWRQVYAKLFKPLINDQSKLLILGTLPGPESLERDEYYANPTNQFWEIINSVFNEPVDSEYSARCKFILEHRLALWDVLDNADRESASDNDIKNEALNDFGELFKHYSNKMLNSSDSL